MKYVKLALQGFIIGIGKIIPGVSGAMFAMMFGVYERALKVISNLNKELKGNFTFISILGSSVLLAIILGSNIIDKCLEKISNNRDRISTMKTVDKIIKRGEKCA